MIKGRTKMNIKKIILITIFFGSLFVQHLYPITAAQAARQQQIVAEIEEILKQNVDEDNYNDWIKEIKEIVNKYKNVNLPEVQKKIKTLQTILSLQNKPESIEEKIKDTNDIKNQESNLSAEEEKNILSYIEDLLKQNITEIDETTNEEIIGYKEWKAGVEQSIEKNKGKSKLIDKKLIELQEKLNKVTVIRDIQEVVDKIKTQLNGNPTSMLQSGHEEAYADWKNKTENTLKLYDKALQAEKKYNINMSQEERDLAQNLLNLYDETEATRKKK